MILKLASERILVSTIDISMKKIIEKEFYERFSRGKIVYIFFIYKSSGMQEPAIHGSGLEKVEILHKFPWSQNLV